MLFLRSCRIIYEDLVTKQVDECDGLMSLFSMPNISGIDILILLVCTLITIYFFLKIILLFRKD